MKKQELAKKIMKYYSEDKYRKANKLLIKNKDDKELFDFLLQDIIFTNQYLKFEMNETIFQKLSESIQKKLIEFYPYLIRFSSDEIRNDKNYIEYVQSKLDNSDLQRNIDTCAYDYIGPKLLNDKEYILSIQDKSPSTFIAAIKRNLFDTETIKMFFNKHPSYLSDLPENLKEDYQYAVSLIEQIPANYLLPYCSNFDYEYLKKEPIKQIIIKNAGEKKYNEILASSIAIEPQQLKSISPEEFKKLILYSPDIFFDYNRWQDLFLKKEQKRNFELINEIKKIAKTRYKNVNSPEKLTKELYELSKSVGFELTYEEICNQVKQYWEEINPWIMQVEEGHKLDDGSLYVIENSKTFFNIYNLLIGIKTKKLEDMFKIFINSDLRGSPYASGIENIEVTEENLSFLQLACTCNLFESDKNAIKKYSNLFIKISEWNNDPYIAIDFVNKLSKDYNLNDLISNINVDSIDQELLLNIFSYVESNINFIYKINNLEELRNYQDFMNNFLNNYQVKNLRDYKQHVLLKHFQINLETAENIIHSYLKSSDNTSLYQIIPEAKYLNYMLEGIINSKDINEIKEINANLDSQKTKISFKDIYEILNKIKRFYGKEINSSLLQAQQTNGIIDVSEINFNMLIHVIGAYGSAPTGDIYDSWNTKEQRYNVSICTSFISDNNMGIARTNKNSVILGFDKLPEDFLELMSCTDLYSSGFKASRSSDFMKSDELKNNTRHGHNEVVIRRRKGKYTEEKIEPSYIICFDEINEKSKVAAEKFRVPIMFIDREKVAKRHHDEIVQMVNEFKTTLNPQLISKIVCEQENNRSGLRVARPDLVEKYFSKEFRQNNIEQLYTAITNGLNSKDNNAIISMNEYVRAIENEEKKYIIEHENKERQNKYDLDYKKMIDAIKNNPLYNEKIKMPEKLSLEELYKRFILCRSALGKAEADELAYMNANLGTNKTM